MKDYKHLILPVIVIIGFAALGFQLLGRIPAMVFTVAFGGGLVLYIATLWRRRISHTRVIVPYLLTVMFFVIHVYEEYLTDFEVTVSRLAGETVPEANFLAIAAFLAPVLWVGGAIMLIKEWAFGFYFLCAFFFAMTIAELAHFVFPLVLDGYFHYESGMYTAALPLIPAYWGLYVMFKEMNNGHPADQAA